MTPNWFEGFVNRYPGHAFEQRAFNELLRRQGGPRSPAAYWAPSRVSEKDVPVSPLVVLPDMGLLASTREWEGEAVKLLVVGGPEGGSHAHADKGSFVLEFAGETFAEDFGAARYGTPLSVELKQAERHNMLIPYSAEGRFEPIEKIPETIVAQGEGDEQSLHARIDLSSSWAEGFEKWTRTFASPSPEQLVIRDGYVLSEGEGVVFYWQTLLPVKRTESGFAIKGKRGEADVSVPADCEVTIDHPELPASFSQETATRVALRRPQASGTLEVTVTLKVKSAPSSGPPTEGSP